MAKAFDDKIKQFRDLNTNAKVLRDMRTAEWRRMKKAFPDSTAEELKDELMSECQVPRDATQCTDAKKQSLAFEQFKLACEQCDEVENAETDGGYDVNDFETL